MMRQLVFCLFLLVSCKPFSYKLVRGINATADTTVKQDTSMQAFLNPLSKVVQQFTSVVVGFTDTPFTAQRPSGMLGSACADWLLHWCDSFMLETHALRCDFAFLNQGGLRNSLPKGKVTLGNMIELMPFENEVVILKLRGTTADSLFSYIISRGGEPVAGMKMEADEKGKYRVYFNGKPFDKQQNYTVATSDYLYNGGDGFNMLKNAVEKWVPQRRLREVFIDEVKRETAAMGAIKKRKDNRIVYANEARVH
jgi:2',3'-cyclic-nucleotide 2'-phosphodiesterase (5'-nucleotidase family)